MDLFEILLIAFFVLIPVMEGVLKKNRTGTPPGGTGPRSRPGTGSGGPARGRPERSGAAGPEATPPPGPAADMVPEDLWELLTGERRRPAPGPVETLPEPSPAAGEGEQWSAEPPWGHEPAPPPTREPVPWMEAPVPVEPVPVEPEPSWPEPVSLEYMGPEAYSLEQPLPSPEVRHARFHEKIEARRRRPRPSSPASLIRSLTRPSGLRDAVVLAEILGPPKGLQ